MARGFIAVNDAFVDHAVDHRRRGGEGGGCLVLLAGLQRKGCLAYGAAQLRGERVIAGSVQRRLSGGFFSRFRIRQAQTPYRTTVQIGPQKSRVACRLAPCLSIEKPSGGLSLAIVGPLKCGKPEYNHGLSPWN